MATMLTTYMCQLRGWRCFYLERGGGAYAIFSIFIIHENAWRCAIFSHTPKFVL